jgi:pyruvate/2-oxoacid:ferredoxin oxidoreductase beta subunit
MTEGIYSCYTRALGLDIARTNNITYTKSSKYHTTHPPGLLLLLCPYNLLISSIKAHTATLYGTSIVIIGGDGGAADVHFLDTDAMSWGTPRVTGARYCIL